MQETIGQNDQILENLRSTFEKDATKIGKMEQELRQLKAEGVKKDELIEKVLKEAKDNRSVMEEAIGEMVDKSDQIYLEYKKALATFGAEPEPLPQDPKGGASGLLNWIYKKFSSLSNNSAVISCERILAMLDREVARICIIMPLATMFFLHTLILVQTYRTFKQ